MYHLLIVDDEPLICQGLSSLLAESGISIDHIYTAHSGYEALDFLRMEQIDLLITDIQMGSMSGIELMQQAKIIKPWVEVIVISAHETFQYAQQAIRLGAKDYLIKPLNNEQLLASVRHVLLHIDKSEHEPEGLLSQLGEDEHFHMQVLLPERDQLLDRLQRADPKSLAGIVAELAGRFNTIISGPYFAVLKLKLNLDSRGKLSGQHEQKKEGYTYTVQDERLLRYAVRNIAAELLNQQWNHSIYEEREQHIAILVQWSDVQYGDSSVDKVNQLEMIGRSLQHNIETYLHLSSVVGISQIFKGMEFINEVYAQAEKALDWSRRFQDHFVFYFGDFKWDIYRESEPDEAEFAAQNNMIVERCRTYIDQNYGQKGLTLNEIAQKNHVSPNYLSYLFKKISGYNLWEYVIKLRMEESKRLLLQTDMRRYEIAESVGYESPEHFSKVFKRYYGVSPSEMKK
ncbi:MAG TPA: response regulator [Candidatus Paenibacillus intestinavium]|nr:response regulator [Candidatus Paenibacillus intestinavium]